MSIGVNCTYNYYRYKKYKLSINRAFIPLFHLEISCRVFNEETNYSYPKNDSHTLAYMEYNVFV